VHNSLGVTVGQSLKQLEHVEPDLIVVQLGEELLAFYVRDVLVDQARRLRRVVSSHVAEFHDVRAAEESYQDLDFPVDFLHPDRFEDLNDYFLVVQLVVALENFRVLAPAQLLHNLVDVLVSPLDGQLLVEGVGRRVVFANILVPLVPCGSIFELQGLE